MFWVMTTTQPPTRKSEIGTPSAAHETTAGDDCNKDEQVDELQYVVDNDDLLDKKVKAKVCSLLWYLVLIPFVLSVSLWLLGTYATKDCLPSSLDVHLWRNFSTHVKQSVKAMDTKYPHNVLLVLLSINTVQVLFCFPLLHVTKIMYGYYIPTRQPAMDLVGFLQYVDSMRSKRLLIPFLVAMHISSVPLITSTCLVLFQVVSRCEFFLSHLIATGLMTFKDTWLGDFLAFSDGNASNIAIAATLGYVSILGETGEPTLG